MERFTLENEYRFYCETEVPGAWTLYDVLLWKAAGVLPVLDYWDDVEGRRSKFYLGEDPLTYGRRLGPRYLDRVHTQLLDLDDDPDLYEVETTGEVETLTAERCRYIINRYSEFADGNERIRNYVEDAKFFLPGVLEFERKKAAWMKKLDDALDVHRSELLVMLRNGKLSARGLRFRVPEQLLKSEVPPDMIAVLDAVWNETTPIPNDFEILLEPIPAKEFITRNIGWEGAFLRNNEHITLAVQIDASEVIRAMPPFASGNVDMSQASGFLFREGKSVKRSGSRRATGRPSKQWDKIYVHIAETIQRDGCLPHKQDAFAQQVCDWYYSECNDTIGLSTVKARLQQFYQNPAFKKSEKSDLT